MGFTFWAVTPVLVGISTWGQALRRAEMILFRSLHSKGVKNARKHKLSKILSVINELWSQWWHHQMGFVSCHWPHVIMYDTYKPKVGRFCWKLVSRDTYDDIIMTSLNRLCPYCHINNSTKFGEDRMCINWVIMFTDTQTLQWQYPSLPKGKQGKSVN